MGMSDLANAKQRVDQIENGVAVIRHMKLELQWIVDQIEPSRIYTLDRGDMAMLGFTVHSYSTRNRGSAMSPNCFEVLDFI